MPEHGPRRPRCGDSPSLPRAPPSSRGAHHWGLSTFQCKRRRTYLTCCTWSNVPVFRPEPVLAKWSTVHRESRNARACTGGDGAKRARRQQMARQGSAAICVTVAVRTNGLRCQCQGDGR